MRIPVRFKGEIVFFFPVVAVVVVILVARAEGLCLAVRRTSERGRGIRR